MLCGYINMHFSSLLFRELKPTLGLSAYDAWKLLNGQQVPKLTSCEFLYKYRCLWTVLRTSGFSSTEVTGLPCSLRLILYYFANCVLFFSFSDFLPNTIHSRTVIYPVMCPATLYSHLSTFSFIRINLHTAVYPSIIRNLSTNLTHADIDPPLHWSCHSHQFVLLNIHMCIKLVMQPYPSTIVCTYSQSSAHPCIQPDIHQSIHVTASYLTFV